MSLQSRLNREPERPAESHIRAARTDLRGALDLLTGAHADQPDISRTLTEAHVKLSWAFVSISRAWEAQAREVQP